MGSKGSTPASQTTNQTQTYKADDRVKDAAHQSIRMGQAAVDQPFQTPTAPVAGLNDFQNQAFQGVQNIQGGWQPYVDAAKGYWDQSASSITGDDVSKYYNPMAQNVFAQLGDQQAQQWGNVTRGLTGAAGGQGASRIAVGQGVLANQQNLATGQVASNLWQQALQAAQQQKQFAAGAAGGMLQTGNAARQGATSDIGLLGQAGLQQQQQSQAELNAPYQNKLQEIAYPYQQAQYLAGLTSGVAPALGGSTAGQSTTTYQPAQPSALSQGIGLGMQGLGMMAGIPPGMGGGGKGGGTAGVGPGMGQPYVMYSARGGRIEEKAEGGEVEPGPTQPGTYVPKSTVPNIQMQPGAGRSTMPSMVGAMKMEHAKQPKDASASTSAGSVASQGLSAISSLTANQDEYAADTEADGGAVFPKHFYAAGGSTSDDWFSGGTEGVNTGPGMGIPGIDFAVDNVDMPKFRTEKPLDESAGLSMQSPFPPPKTGIGTGSGSSALALPPPPPPQNMEESFDKFSKASGAGWASRALGSIPSMSSASPAQKEPSLAGDESAGLNMQSPFPAPAAAPTAQGQEAAGSTAPAAYPVFPRAGENDEYSSGDGPVGGIHPYGRAIAMGESGGRYDAVGPRTRTGDQAYGKYQVMGANIPAWTEKYYGKSLTPQEFLHNRQAQEDVFRGEFGRLQRAHGPLGAARAWFAGEGGMNDRGRKDVLGTTVDSYERKFAANAGDLGNVEVTSAGRNAPSISRDDDNNRYDLPRTRQPYPDATDRDWGQQAARSPWNSLIRAGAVVASSPGPFGSALARGIAAGADQLQSERATRQKEVGVNQRAQQLHQQAQAHLDQYGRMTPFQKASLEAGKFTPFNYMGADGKPAVGAFNAKTGQLFDGTTGELISGATQLQKPGGSGGAGSTAMIKNIEYMVGNGMATSKEEALARLKTAATNPYARSDVVRRWVDTMRKDPNNAAKPDSELKAQAERVVDDLIKQSQTVAPAAPAAAAPAAPAAKPIPKDKVADAKKWLSEHPDDPRAAAILESLKASGE